MNEVLIDGVATMQQDDLAERLWGELDQLSAQDQVVQAIVWGDEDITASVEAFLAQVHREERGPLVIRSVAAAVLIEDTVSASVSQLQALAASVDEIVHHLRCGTDDEAIARLPAIFDGLQSIEPLLEMLDSRELLDPSQMERLMGMLGGSLSDLQIAWEQKNFVQMADLLKFGLSSMLIQAHDTLSNLAVDLTLARLGNRS